MKKVMTLGEQLENARNAMGWSVHEAAERVGVSVTGYKNWESDKSLPHRDKLPMLRKLFNAHLVTDGIEVGIEVTRHPRDIPGMSEEALEYALKLSSIPERERRAIETLIDAQSESTNAARKKKPTGGAR